MSRLVIALAFSLLTACQPKQPLQPSFYTQKPASSKTTCRQTLECYWACTPLTEECMLLCDQRSDPHAIDRARAVPYCSAQHGCTDKSCTYEKCPNEIQTCTSPQVAPAPRPMQPQPYPGQAGSPPPMQPQPYPGQAGAAPPMQPQPYPGQSPPPPPSYAPR